MFKANDEVEVKQPVLKGLVKERRFNAADDVEYLVVFPDGGERWFTFDLIEASAPAIGV
jgi:hypothetical protein